MSKKRSKKASREEFLVLVEEKLGKEFTFDPAQSMAVCVGVGRHINKAQKVHDVPTCEHDPDLMSEISKNRLGIPSKNVAVLSSSHEYVASASNIKHCLTSSAEKIGPKGMFLFYFSGHVIMYKGVEKTALVPADYNSGTSELMTAEWIATSLIRLRETDCQIVIILDCSAAAHVATGIVEAMRSKGFCRLSALAACAATETSYSFDHLGASFFTFFMHDYFVNRVVTPGCLSLEVIYEHCNPVCNAMASLILNEDVVEGSMNPAVIGTNLETVVLDESDGKADASTRGKPDRQDSDWLVATWKYLDYCFQEDLGVIKRHWSKEICQWLNIKVASNLQVLAANKVLKNKRVMETVFCLIMQSIAVKTMTVNQALACNPHTPIYNYYRVVEEIGQVEATVFEAKYDFLAPAVQHYIKVVKKYLKPDADILPLAGIYRTLTLDQQARAQDETDGRAETADKTKLADEIPDLPDGLPDHD